MLKTVEVINYLGDSIILDLRNPASSGFLIKEIEGLGPVTSDINVTDLATNDGGIFNSSRLQTRNIVFTLQYLFNPTIEDMRRKSYKYFPTKKELTLIFETDSRKAAITGYVESNEIDFFSKDEGSQISIICPDPYFYSVSDSGEDDSTVFSGLTPAFEFIFSNESLTEDLIEFGIIQNLSQRSIPYDGDADTGVTITIHATARVENISIYNVNTREQMKINTDKLEAMTGSPMVSGDDIIICTIKGRKSITLLRGGVYTNILNCLDKNSDWFQLTRGDNIFTYDATVGAYNIQFKVQHPVIYEGI